MTVATLTPLLISLFILAYWVLVVVSLIAEDRDPTTTLAWILILWLLPVAGLVLYFFAGRDWAGRTLKRRWVREWHETATAFLMPRYAPFAQRQLDLESNSEGTVTGRITRAIKATNGVPALPSASVEIWEQGSTYFPRLIADLMSATDHIHMQYFIWENDTLTQEICDTLIDRLNHGVEVRILNDFIGNIGYKKTQLKAVRAAGAIWQSDQTQLGKLNYRNHRKITVVDGRVAHSGGFNIGQEYIDGGSRYPAWRDTGLRITGPSVARLQDLFAQRWWEVREESLYTERYFPVWTGGDEGIMTQTVAHGVEEPWRASARAYEVAIASAEQRVLIQSPYYVPTDSMQAALLNAALSGVEVHFMMTGWPDKKVAFFAAQSFFRPLLKAGAHIWMWEKGFFHAKSLTVDGLASAIGTMNLDTRSLDLHKELMVWFYDKTIATRCEEIFFDDLKECREITLEEVDGYSSLRRFRNSAARLASKLM